MAGRARSRRLIAMVVLAAFAQLACGRTPESALSQAPRTHATQSTQMPAAALEVRRCSTGPDARDLSTTVEALLEDADAIASLRAVVVARSGVVLAERGYDGARPDTPANIKSASKTVMSALVGIAIDKGLLDGVDQPIAPLLKSDLPRDPDPRLARVTIGHLLSMQAGLERTSGPYYGRWVSSDNWVRDALARPFVDEPGGGMLYSTGSTHLLSAILARASGRPVRELAREWLGPQAGFVIASWDRDPQGIHFGGNNMAMDTRSLLAFGELYRSGGVSRDGRRLLSQAWIDASWQPRTRSRFTGDGYGYGWFLRNIAGEPVRYAWGYGGQMLYVVPSLDLVLAMTSDDGVASARSGHRDALHALAGAIIEAVGCSP
ncbi:MULTISPECIES: serine hydrolase [unclassified Luteimonas]|uniref:serine hydrolase domain-containing protein n=1 Tax=unclassified Luteimonas TaxID=2629088 RepID=UPI0018F0F2E8|nr:MULTISPECIES: serine hydrolase [unclassified Luteimonas]MBJ6979378.1 serine hydrolase [Luteimonas sp. MC1895]MBJ6984407.1 serine hydrolase [Luteimonas sp. MC1750]QQO04974.1 serine hydrolase [Luteimonas sp. MC1750]